MSKTPIQAVPTNIITGFLGVGKTSLIKQLLSNKPSGERWAILVNEFGEVGIDGAMLSGDANSKVFVKEVPGGCMCCTSGLPMQIALNVLLSKARPHRLLIEPTGLGHPTEVLATLTAEHYREVLDIRTTLTLVDARKVTDSRYREHSTFQEQLQIADVVCASKVDLYRPDDVNHLKDYLKQLGVEHKKLLTSGSQTISVDLLDGLSTFSVPEPDHHHDSSGIALIDADERMQQHGWTSVSNQGEGFVSYGWVFSSKYIFDYKKVVSMLSYLDVERLKAVMITEQGVFVFNFSDGVLSQHEIDETNDSRLEFIASDNDLANELAKRLEWKLIGETKVSSLGTS
jgi:G3E family GTPase